MVVAAFVVVERVDRMMLYEAPDGKTVFGVVVLRVGEGVSRENGTATAGVERVG